MKKIKWLFGLAILLGGLVACNEDVVTTESIDEGQLKMVSYSQEIIIPDPCGYGEFTLWAGQTIDAGQVIVYNDASNLYVTVIATVGFQSVSENIKMWVGTDLTTLDGGGISRPSAGGFPYKVTVTGSTTTHTFTIPLETVPGYNATVCGVQTIWVVVHVDILAPDGNGGSSAQTAWGGGDEGPGNAWWYLIGYIPDCCGEEPPPTPEYFLETAFAYGTHVFVTQLKGKKEWSNNPDQLPYLGLTQNRWGWAINLTGNDPVSYDIWAGAGLNHTENGTLVGTATVEWDGAHLTVTYDMNGDFLMEEAHVYASDLVPNTIAPGQYGNTYYFDPYSASETYTYDVSDSNGDGIWIIMHAVVALPI